MPNETIDRLVRATAGEDDDPGLTRVVQRAMGRFMASLPAGPALQFEEILQSVAQAAEELPANASAAEIRDRARQIRSHRI